MKKIAQQLLFAAILTLQPAFAQSDNMSAEEWNRKYRELQLIQEYQKDSLVEAHDHEQSMLALNNSREVNKAQRIENFLEMCQPFVFIGLSIVAVIVIMVIIMRNQQKTIDKKHILIEKMMEKGLLSAENTISRKTLDSILYDSNSNNDKNMSAFINDVTIMSIGAGIILTTFLWNNYFTALIGTIAFLIGLTRLIVRTIIVHKENKNKQQEPNI